MFHSLFKTGAVFVALSACLSLSNAVVANEQQTLHLYNWSDYIAPDTVANFEKETGIKVTYDVYDSNEILETKLFAGNSGYDLVFPTSRPFAGRHIKAGIYQPLDKSLLTNLANIDPIILNSLVDLDTNNTHLVPYLWGTTGVGINVKKVREILGNDMPLDTWQLLFNPEIVSKLASCGVSLMDDPTEVFTAVRIFNGNDPSDFSKKATERAAETIKAIRPHIKYFHSSQYINDLANGDSCVAHGYSGDVLQAKARAEEANNGVEIIYLAPAEGAVVWTDVMAIPKDAKNVAAAHQFINFMMRPKEIAQVTNYVSYANANNQADSFVDPKITADPGIYPPKATLEKLVILHSPSDKESRTLNRLWTRLKTNM
ncbi:putrescine transport system substrate-binding protein [Pseudoalteromonas ulvae UL12]|uniref:polyamine ABC transporter substrate-binding protein n=1 Tax=Pseudoalteromonas ulvae TaxID=107327 RepID=UPI00186BA108|nr:polyamine ABC transporter substrate-binding protein [Pseudoalteromonas ulvae]MBE0364464.1 putrescine transport system substrate-binding protein [Pseudoalteromonas ulvae UL12]